MTLQTFCKTVGCSHPVAHPLDYCDRCQNREPSQSLSERYPENFKSLGDLTELDVYAVHHLFQIQDPSGCIQHASRKLLSTTPSYADIREARDTLTRWLQLNQEKMTT